MPLEATMFCLDNSGYMRNGDYHPTRLASQMDAVYRLAEAKINGNPESTVGFLTMAGDRVDVHVTPTRDLGKFLTCSKAITPSGECDLVTGIKIAHLTLKNRPNRSHRPRIVLFIGSPISDDDSKQQELVKLGAQLKKNNIALDIVHFGTENSSNANESILSQLLNAVQNQSNSNILTVPPGPHGLAQMIGTSAIMGDDRPSSFSGHGAVGGSAAGAADDEFGDDPELLAAIRASMEMAEQENLQQATSASRTAGGTAAAAGASSAPPAPPAPPAAAAAAAAAIDEDAFGDDPELLAAIALSLQTNAEEDAAAASSSSNNNQNANNASQSSSGTAGSSSAAGASEAPKTEEEQLDDPAFMSALLADAGFDASYLDDDEDDHDKDKKEAKK